MRLSEFPAAGGPAGQPEQDDSRTEEDGNFRSEVADGLVAPEDFGVSGDGPGIEGEVTHFDHGIRHEEFGKHTATKRGHGEDDEGGKGSELGASASEAGEQHAERRHGKG